MSRQARRRFSISTSHLPQHLQNQEIFQHQKDSCQGVRYIYRSDLCIFEGASYIYTHTHTHEGSSSNCSSRRMRNSKGGVSPRARRRRATSSNLMPQVVCVCVRERERALGKVSLASPPSFYLDAQHTRTQTAPTHTHTWARAAGRRRPCAPRSYLDKHTHTHLSLSLCVARSLARSLRQLLGSRLSRLLSAAFFLETPQTSSFFSLS